MHIQTTKLQGLEITLTAHRDAEQSLLHARVRADETDNPARPLRIALVLDRSGSMAGAKLQSVRAATAAFLRSLRSEDRVAVFAYDDRVRTLANLQAPGEALSRKVEALVEGGSTNLYGGWLEGAKAVGEGGRVVLLSDGLANVGHYTSAPELARHAGLSYERFGVTTTTIGVGEDYDEALMAGMARQGGGAHYFAHSVESILQAFAQERHSVGAVEVSHVSIAVGGLTRDLGHFWGGEEKNAVLPIDRLQADAAVRYTLHASGKTLTASLAMPTSFGHSEDATLEFLLQQAAELEESMVQVVDPRSAGEKAEAARKLILDILAHPAADSAVARAAVDRLEAARERLQELQEHFDARKAVVHRKRSLQSSHNLRERTKAFSAFEDESVAMEAFMDYSVRSSVADEPLAVELQALALAPLERWRAWRAVPVGLSGSVIRVVTLNARDGFVLSEIERETGMAVKPTYRRVTVEEIESLLDEAAATPPGAPR